MACCHLLVPVKRLARAKTRLDHPMRADLALAFACDTVTAALASGIMTVTVITDDSRVRERMRGLGVPVVADVPDAGLNPALRHAAITASADCWVGASSADLPAARPDEFAALLAEATAAGGTGAFVPDRGRGTTVLLRPSGHALDPRFGADSAAQHRRTGAASIGAELTGLRIDVDTAEDLADAVARGVGAHTAAVLAAARPRV
jgi:2-phospho-L-lactate guanylyltransferase